MNIHELTPIRTKRTDPTTGIEYTFTANPPINLNIWDLKPGIVAKDFIVLLLWQIKAGIWDTGDFENLIDQTTEVLPLINQVVGEVGFYIEDAAQMLERVKPGDKTRVKPGDKFGYHYYVKPVVNSEPTDESAPSDEMLRVLCKEVLHSLPLEVAVSWFIDINKKELDHQSEEINDIAVSWFDQVNETEATRQTENLSEESREDDQSNKKRSLLANSAEIDLSKAHGIHKGISDSLVRIINYVNKDHATNQYNKDGSEGSSRTKNTTFRVPPRSAGEPATELVLDKHTFNIKTADDFFSVLLKIKDVKVLKSFSALWHYANAQNSATFHNTPISDIMSVMLKPDGSNLYNKKQRQEFTGILYYLSSLMMNTEHQVLEYSKKLKKKVPVLKRFTNVRLFSMEATHSVKKEFQNLPPEELIIGTHYDESVITRFSGKLLPDHEMLLTERANVYLNSLFKLDTNKDAKAFLLGFMVQTRFNQIQDKEKCVSLDRGYLIKLFEYEKTNAQKPAVATNQIRNNLEKLKKFGIIARYNGLTNNDIDKVSIYPPKIDKPVAID